MERETKKYTMITDRPYAGRGCTYTVDDWSRFFGYDISEKREDVKWEPEAVINDEMIAKFMDWSSCKTEHDTFWNPVAICTIENWVYHSSSFQFSSSWDWLMPVVQKWVGLYLRESFLKDRSTDTYNMYIELCERLDRSMIKNYDINAVYNQLLKNIQWYNNQKKTN